MRQSFEKGKISCCKISATYNHLQQEGALGPNQGPHPPTPSDCTIKYTPPPLKNNTIIKRGCEGD